jgi:hypothetical protein
MREVLKERFESIPVHVPRSEIEAMGVEIGLDDPTEASRIFRQAKGHLVEGQLREVGRRLGRRLGRRSDLLKS